MDEAERVTKYILF